LLPAPSSFSARLTGVVYRTLRALAEINGGLRDKMFLVLVLAAGILHLGSLNTYALPPQGSAVSVAENADSASAAQSDSVNAADSVVSAQEQALSEVARSRSTPGFDFALKKEDTGFNLLGIFSAILIVFGLLILFLHLLRKFVYRPLGGLTSGKHFQLLQQFHLGPKKTIALVKVYGKLLLLGVTESTITNLLEIQDEEEVADIESRINEARKNEGPNFRELYQGVLSRFKK